MRLIPPITFGCMLWAGMLPAAEEETPAKIYDPLAGMDASGRIHKVALPEDLPNRDRWRYIPEGRIKPGNVFERFPITSFVAPIVKVEGDIGAGGGIALTDIDFRNQRRQEFLGLFLTYTTEGQQRYRTLWRRWMHHRELPGGGVAVADRSFWHASTGYERTLTRRFFGLGPDTEEDDETSYTNEFVDAQVGFEKALPLPGDDLVVGLTLRGERHNLAPGHVSAVPSSDERFPQLVEAADGYAALGLIASARYDLRDSTHAPYDGGHIGLEAALYPAQEGFDPGAVFTLEGSYVWPVAGLFHDNGGPDEEHPPTDVFALGGHVRTSAGELPFFQLPSLGGSRTLRGYIGNRFTGDSAWHASAEYRFWVLPRGIGTPPLHIERLGFATFVDVGSVADSVDDLGEAEIHTSYGGSLRISLERQAQFRFDVGFSEEGSQFTIAYGMPF